MWRLASLGALCVLGLGGACGGSGEGSSSFQNDGGGGASASSAQGAAGPGGGDATGTASGPVSGGGGSGGSAFVDLDGDGLDDADEAAWAAAYLPYLSDDPDDGCPVSGIVYRVHPHPDDPAFVHIVYDRLYDDDCGLTGHAGDNEVF